MNIDDKFLGALHVELPYFRVLLRSQSLFLTIIFWPIKLIARRSYANYATTIFRTIYVPDGWQRWDPWVRYRLLRHEAEHLRQFRYWPMHFLGNTWAWWVNAIIVSFLYLFCLPVLWTMRSYFERRGFTESLLCYSESGELNDPAIRAQLADWIAETFGGAGYLYMWTRGRARRWALDTMQRILDGKISNPHRVEP